MKILVELDDETEYIDVFDKNPITGYKTKNMKKSYKMEFVQGRIGFKMRLEDKYFVKAAIE